MPKLLLLVAAAVLVCGCSAADWMNGLTPRTGSIDSDIVFDKGTGMALDVYTPRNVRDAPVVVFFYPGRWCFGEKSDYRFVAEGLIQNGFVVVIPNYRLFPRGHFPDFLEDAAAAVVWTRENIARYHGDPDRLFVMGHSSGAYNAAMLALDERYLAAAGGNRDWLRGVVGVSGPYDFAIDASPELPGIFGALAEYEQSQPVHFVDGEGPPMLLLHGVDDKSIPVESTRRLARKMKATGASVETVIYEEMDHGYILASLSPTVRLRDSPREFIVRFLRAHSGIAPGPVR